MPIDAADASEEIATLKALLAAERAARGEAEARAEKAEVRASSLDAEIANLKLTIAKMRRDKFGSSSEHAGKLDQLELQLAELVEHVSEDKTTDAIDAPVDGAEMQKPAH